LNQTKENKVSVKSMLSKLKGLPKKELIKVQNVLKKSNMHISELEKHIKKGQTVLSQKKG